MKKFTLSKKERLKSKKALAHLFKGGKTFAVFPLRVFYHPVQEFDEPYGIKCAFSVPKRSFRKAVDRNRLKRLMRECYRLNKPDLCLMGKVNPAHLVLLYYAPDHLEYPIIEKATKRILKRLIKELSLPDD